MVTRDQVKHYIPVGVHAKDLRPGSLPFSFFKKSWCTFAYQPTLPVFAGVSKFFIQCPSLSFSASNLLAMAVKKRPAWKSYHHLFVFLCCVEGYKAKQLNPVCLNLSVIKISSSFHCFWRTLRSYVFHFVVFTKSLLNTCTS